MQGVGINWIRWISAKQLNETIIAGIRRFGKGDWWISGTCFKQGGLVLKREGVRNKPMRSENPLSDTLSAAANLDPP
jgi:hypothetical protein